MNLDIRMKPSPRLGPRDLRRKQTKRRPLLVSVLFGLLAPVVRMAHAPYPPLGPILGFLIRHLCVGFGFVTNPIHV